MKIETMNQCDQDDSFYFGGQIRVGSYFTGFIASYKRVEKIFSSRWTKTISVAGNVPVGNVFVRATRTMCKQAGTSSQDALFVGGISEGRQFLDRLFLDD